MSSQSKEYGPDSGQHLLRPESFFELSGFHHAKLLEVQHVWEALLNIELYIEEWARNQGEDARPHDFEGATLVDPDSIFIGKGTVVEPGAYIAGPTIIGRDCVIRQGAYLRGKVVAGDRVVIGHATEAKNAILLNDSKAPHFAYVGDSILGSAVNLGAGSCLSNLPITSIKDPITKRRPTISISLQDKIYDTGLSKLGAILGDGVEIGCNAVLSPGCLVGPRSIVYPSLSLRKGYYSAGQIIKLRQTVITATRRI